MKKLFAIIAVATMSAGAQAATEFKWNGSINQTFNMNSNPKFLNAGGAVENDWLQKNQLGMSAKASDKLMGYFNLMHVGVWGATTSNGMAYDPTGVGKPNTTLSAVSPQNAVTVSEAWMWWKATDSLSFKSGRNPVTFGDGFAVSKNDGLPYPIFFDSVLGRWGSDMLDIDFGGAKTSESGLSTAGNTTDTEIVFYGANIGIKSLPDMFKKFDLFVVQANGDSGTSSTAAVPFVTAGGAWNVMAYGLYTKMDFSMVDLGVNLVMESGKQKAATDVTLSAMGYDVELGLNLPEFMKARIYVGYHSDAGDDTSTADKNEGYQPLFGDITKFSAAGVWGMGNLTNITAGVKLAMSDDTSFGAEYTMASRTTKNFTGSQSVVSAAVGNQFQPSTTVDSTQTALGNVIGLWAKHNYGSGFSIGANLNMISLGSYYKPTGATVGDGMGVKVNATYNF